jgi:FlaA1/EpsC-like NDP-sugar epimerase
MPKARLRRRSDKMQVALAVAAGAMWAGRVLRSDPSYTFRGKIVLITGGSRGLGLALARDLARKGARLAICGRDPDSLERARASLARAGAQVVAASCDVTDRRSVEELIQQVTY